MKKLNEVHEVMKGRPNVLKEMVERVEGIKRYLGSKLEEGG